MDDFDDNAECDAAAEEWDREDDYRHELAIAQALEDREAES
jgi:hypothetical protein